MVDRRLLTITRREKNGALFIGKGRSGEWGPRKRGLTSRRKGKHQKQNFLKKKRGRRCRIVKGAEEGGRKPYAGQRKEKDLYYLLGGEKSNRQKGDSKKGERG